jgi:hypothetical protein
MLQNFLTIAMRNLWRNKFYTLINVLGMGIGIAAVVWGWQTYRFSFSFNNFHPEGEKIFWAIVSKEGTDEQKGITPLPLATVAKSDFSSIESAVRWDSWWTTLKADQSEPFSLSINFTEPGFFDLFHFPLVAGSNDLSDPSAVLLTEKTATRFFGKENPLGKTLLVYAGEPRQLPLTVKGVLKDPPLHSSIRFEVLTNRSNQIEENGAPVPPDDWTKFTGATFFKLYNPTDAPRLAQDFKKYAAPQNAARPDWKVTGFSLAPLSEVASMAEYVGSNSLYERPEDSAAFGPLVLAILIFLSACLNFANTTVARSNQRLKEMGVRKVMGGTQAQLMRQLLLECSFIVLLGAALSMQLNQWWLPYFNQMFGGILVEAHYLSDPPLVIFMAAMLIGSTVLAGAYPAFYISRFNPSRIFSGTVKFGGSNLFSRLLLG